VAKHVDDSDLPPRAPDIPEEPGLPGKGVLLWSSGRPGLADPINPATLAGLHPVWAEDALTYAPWQEVSIGHGSICGTPALDRVCGDSGKPARSPDAWWLSRKYAGGRVVVCGPCTSSLDVARHFVENKAFAPWDSALAVSQRSGRGQLGRSWSSPPGNVYGALFLPAVPKAWDSLLSLVMGYCLVLFLRAKNFPACIKWPNDILVSGKKVAGVLIEERNGRCVAGVGINLASAPPEWELREDHAAPAGSLRAAAGFTGTALETWCDLVDSVRTCYEDILARQETAGMTAARIEPFLCWRGEEA